ncbi:Dihydrofolate reductase [Termitomyces sp. J132]|nr:Dihydrofolate reductase [Termitomyces sp. J132]
MLRLTIIVAATKSNGIGQNAGLPWRLPREMKYFAQVTTAGPEGTTNAVLMGRNTWESIPEKHRPLSGRVNLVTSRNADYVLQSSNDTPSYLHNDLASALGRLNSSTQSYHKAFIIGGASLYSEALALKPSSSAAVDRILLTRILTDFNDCDVFMPDFLREGEERGLPWTQSSHRELEEWVGFKVPEGVQEEKGVQYEFQMWTRPL